MERQHSIFMGIKLLGNCEIDTWKYIFLENWSQMNPLLKNWNKSTPWKWISVKISIEVLKILIFQCYSKSKSVLFFVLRLKDAASLLRSLDADLCENLHQWKAYVERLGTMDFSASLCSFNSMDVHHEQKFFLS